MKNYDLEIVAERLLFSFIITCEENHVITDLS